MLSHCANPQCLKPFLRLRQGRLFLVETDCTVKMEDMTNQASPYVRHPPRHVERYWLCDRCAEIWTLVHDRNHGIALLPLRRPVASGGSAAMPGCRESA